MAPTLQPGAIALFVSKTKYHVGDIVLLRHDGLDKIKRIAMTDKNSVYLLGDNAQESTDSRQFGWLSVHTIQAGLILHTSKVGVGLLLGAIAKRRLPKHKGD